MGAYVLCDDKDKSGYDILFVFKVANRTDRQYRCYGCKAKYYSFNYLVSLKLEV